MLLEGRKHPRIDERFLVQVSSAHDPLLIELASVENLSVSGWRLATKRPWELGSHVDVIGIARVLKARARVVYCKGIGPERFAVGLNLIARDGQAKLSTK
jgi:hypothetical protein